MKRPLLLLFILTPLLSCKKGAEIKPGEVEATVTGYVIADYWSKGCSIGGLTIDIGGDHYTITNHLSPDYEDPNAWPIPVWVRYDSSPADSCSQGMNRIKILSIRQIP